MPRQWDHSFSIIIRRENKMEVKFGKKVFIRDIGKDEYWLHDILYDNPNILGLGCCLTPVKREKRESSGGRFHILLKDLICDIRYEVEVMLGETDPSHIISSLEYWDNEKHRHFVKHHFAVLIAESFEGKYFKLLQTLSMNLPMIAFQANLLEVNKEYVLSFSKIFDLYRGPEDREGPITVDKSVWSEKCPWTLNAAKALYGLIDADDKSIDYMENSISIYIQGRRAYLLKKSSEPASVVSFKVFDDDRVDAIRDVFYNNNFTLYNLNRNKEFVINVDEDMISRKKSLFQEIMKIRYKSLLSHR
jgi:hypothetical protein